MWDEWASDSYSVIGGFWYIRRNLDWLRWDVNWRDIAEQWRICCTLPCWLHWLQHQTPDLSWVYLNLVRAAYHMQACSTQTTLYTFRLTSPSYLVKIICTSIVAIGLVGKTAIVLESLEHFWRILRIILSKHKCSECVKPLSKCPTLLLSMATIINKVNCLCWVSTQPLLFSLDEYPLTPISWPTNNKTNMIGNFDSGKLDVVGRHIGNWNWWTIFKSDFIFWIKEGKVNYLNRDEYRQGLIL